MQSAVVLTVKLAHLQGLLWEPVLLSDASTHSVRAGVVRDPFAQAYFSSCSCYLEDLLAVHGQHILCTG